jgi:hypothetical protein
MAPQGAHMPGLFIAAPTQPRPVWQEAPPKPPPPPMPQHTCPFAPQAAHMPLTQRWPEAVHNGTPWLPSMTEQQG